MRSYISLIFSVMAIFAVGCDVFLVDGIGGDGEPCSGDGNCEPGLACNFGECGPPVQEGEECSSQSACESDLWCVDGVCVELGGPGQLCIDCETEWGACECDQGLRCIDGICEPPTDTDEVKQPNANLYWLRCSVGHYWDGWECLKDSDFDTSGYDGEPAQSTCPSGYRLPTRSEMVVLLSGCDSYVLDGYHGYCNPCEESDNCSVMFEQKSGELWTSTKIDVSFGYYYWTVDFGNGKFDQGYSAQEKHGVSCVRSGG